MKLFLLFVFILNITSQSRVGDFFIARYNGTIKQSLTELITRSENFLREYPHLPSHVTRLYSSQFGSIFLHVIRPNSLLRFQQSNHSEYIKVERGKLEFNGRSVKRLKQLDGIMFNGKINYGIRNLDNAYTAFTQVKAPMTINSMESKEKIEISSFKKVATNLNMGTLYVDGASDIDINQIGQKLIDQNQRLSSALVSINRGISLTMFVLKGISGCHKHMRSDYIAWNGYGGSLQHLKFPEKFDSLLNDPVVMPITVRHNLYSHNNESNIMLLFQFPPQATSDSQSEVGCNEP